VLLLFIVGCAEWWLALWRTRLCAQGCRWALATVVLVEQLLGLWVLRSVVVSSDWAPALCYSVGGALGALASTYQPRRKT